MPGSTTGASKGFHVVAVGNPVPRRRQERARAACLTALVGELHGFGVQYLLIEVRAPAVAASVAPGELTYEIEVAALIVMVPGNIVVDSQRVGGGPGGGV